ncbi:aminotransferase class IV [Funiculus sociatus]|uniref:aminotransferase class IV n=1 Tax=Funiculus sociatus TaxID=450527 RepID=UPI003298D080
MYWYNGNLIQSGTLELAIDDPGLLYGATVFSTLRVYQSLDNPLTSWNGHCDRIRLSLLALGWQQPDWERSRYGAETLTTHFPILRITIFPDGREWITGRFLPIDLTQRQKYGISALLIEPPITPPPGVIERSLPQHKTGNYLAAWLAMNKAKKFEAQEAILVDELGNWLETSTGNLWGWRDGKWWTPPIDGRILPGIMRSQLINWLVSQNQPVGEVAFDANWVKGLSAVAYSNSVVEVVPIHTVITSESQITYDPTHSSLEQLRRLHQSDRRHKA